MYSLGIDNLIIEHNLSVNPEAKRVRQKRRPFSIEKCMAVAEEIEKLQAAGFIRAAHYPEWLFNVVLVKKANGKWRMCIDFTDLNKPCPKDSFPLPRINVIMDATIEQQFLSFMDAYSVYNQIRMNKADEEKTAFITNRGLYCYRVMPFGQKDVRATYQRLVNRMFKHQIGKSMEVYVDDLFVKSKDAEQHLTNLRESLCDIVKVPNEVESNKMHVRGKFGQIVGVHSLAQRNRGQH
ncbi:hypothetical protein F2P56_024455 [Juglans regia]|uniref:Reverse transcriptase domain-containing protein n=1 Tax=Juglans regia TaxID=51240 RepID=A0A833UBX5_JUGRE|nr:hypothetical protein F2P56_024455 [Juglans regia]